MPLLRADRPIRSCRGTSASCLPRCGVCGCTSILWSMSGAARWWPGMWLRWSRLRSSRPIWCSGPASRSATAAPAALAAASASSSPLSSILTTAMPSRRLLAELRGATLESLLEEMGVLRSFSSPRVSNDNPYSKSHFRRVKYCPGYPNRPFAIKDEARNASGWRPLSTGTITGSGTTASS